MSQAQWQDNNDLLLSLNISELADLPEQTPFPTGTYQFQWNGMTSRTKETEEGVKLQVSIGLLYQGATELAKEEDAVDLENVEAGSEHTFSFFPHSPFGQGFMKRALMPLCQQTGIDNVAALNDALAGSLVSVQIDRSKDKRDESKWNINLLGITKV